MASENSVDYNLLRLSTPAPTIRNQSASEFLRGSQEIRDARRKRAIEEAMRSGLDASGNLDTESIRKSLIAQGFGENADQLVREMSMARLGDAATTADVGYKLSNFAKAGIIDPQIAENLFRRRQEVTYDSPTTSTQTQEQTFSGVPGQSLTQPSQTTGDVDADGNIIIRGGQTTQSQLSSMAPPQAPREVSKFREFGAQAVPDYLQDLVKFGNDTQSGFGGASSTSASKMSWNVPSDPELKTFALKTADALGYDMTSAATPLYDQMRDRAESAVPQVAQFYPPMDPKDLSKSLQAHEQAKLDRKAKVEEHIAKQAEAFEAGIRNYASEGRAKAGEIRAEAGERRADRTARISQNPLDPKTNRIIWKEVTPQALEKIETGLGGLVDMESAKTRYFKTGSLGDLADFAAGSLKAEGMPVTMDAIETEILKSGAVPAESELKFKKALRDMNITDLAGFKAMSWVGLGIKPTKAEESTLNEFVSNLKSRIYRRGGNVPGYTPTAADILAAKGVGDNRKDEKPSGDSGTRSSKKGR